jgi:hypothetical protein
VIVGMVVTAGAGERAKLRPTPKTTQMAKMLMVAMVRASPVLVPKAVWPEPAPAPKAALRPPPCGF